MKPLCPVEPYDQQTSLNLIVYDHINKIEEKANKWFERAVLLPHYNIQHYDPELLRSVPLEHQREHSYIDCTQNCNLDLEYLFSMAIWWVDLAEGLGFKLSARDSLERLYQKYTQNEDGHRYLVTDPRYNASENRLYSESERKERDEEMERLSREVADDFIDQALETYKWKTK